VALRESLQAVVDYRGFRLLCMSILPISNETLQLGSSDGGRSSSPIPIPACTTHSTHTHTHTHTHTNTLAHTLRSTGGAARHVSAGDCELREKVDKMARQLYLRTHSVRGVRLPTPADLEGHHGMDGKFYLVDFSRFE
jgi:hypothetical protein